MSRRIPPSLHALVHGPWLDDAVHDLAKRLRRRGARGPGQRRLVVDPGGTARKLARLLDAGRWAPRPPHEIAIPKRHGGVRPLSLLRPEDQLVHGALQRLLSHHLEPRFADTSWGFRPARSARVAAARAARWIAAGRRWAADLDVHDCFGTIRHDLLLDQLRTMDVTDPPLLALISHLARVCAPARSPLGSGLAQGSPLSPVLANAHLHPVDEAMAGEPGYQRYADDLVCLCASEEGARRALVRMTGALTGRGQRPSGRKSGVHRVEEGWGYLGWVTEGAEARARLVPPPRRERAAAAGRSGLRARERYRRRRSQDPSR